MKKLYLIAIVNLYFVPYLQASEPATAAAQQQPSINQSCFLNEHSVIDKQLLVEPRVERELNKRSFIDKQLLLEPRVERELKEILGPEAIDEIAKHALPTYYKLLLRHGDKKIKEDKLRKIAKEIAETYGTFMQNAHGTEKAVSTIQGLNLSIEAYPLIMDAMQSIEDFYRHNNMESSEFEQHRKFTAIFRTEAYAKKNFLAELDTQELDTRYDVNAIKKICPQIENAYNQYTNTATSKDITIEILQGLDPVTPRHKEFIIQKLLNPNNTKDKKFIHIFEQHMRTKSLESLVHVKDQLLHSNEEIIANTAAKIVQANSCSTKTDQLRSQDTANTSTFEKARNNMESIRDRLHELAAKNTTAMTPLQKDNQTSFYTSPKEWISENPKKTAGIVVGATAITAVGLYYLKS